MKVIKKYDQGSPITTGGAGYIPTAQPSTEQLKNAANKLGEWFLKGMGFIGDVLSTGLAYGSVSPNILEPISDETIQQRKEAAGKVFSAVSPLNYGVALTTGHGLNPYAGEEEIATWEPYQQALGRGLEMYLTPKAIKAGKAGIKRGVQEVSHKKLPYKSPELTIFQVDEDINTGPKVKVVRNVKKPWKTDPSKVNNTTRFYIEGAEDRGYFELVKDFEPRQYSVHFKPTEADNPHAFSDVEKKVLFKAVADAVPAGSSLSTWGTLTRGGVHGLNRFGNLGFTKTGTRSVHMKSGEPIDIPIFTKKAKPFYFINHLPGFQLKSLMRGNPLEQQLSENGTISVNNILNYMSRRSKMEQEVVRQVLNQEQFRGQSKIDYSTFNKAVHDHLLNFQVNLDDFAPQNSNIQIFDFGDIDSEPLGPLDLQVKKQYLSNYEMPKRSEAFANSIEEARILKNVAAYEEEIAQIDKGPLNGYSNYDIFIAQLSGDYPPGMFEALQRRGQLYRQIDQLLNRYDDILSTSGGARYSQLKHLKQDYTTKLIQQTLRQASSIGYKQIFYDNNPTILRRLKKLGVDFRVRDPRIIVKVPKNYEQQEIQFKQGGKV